MIPSTQELLDQLDASVSDPVKKAIVASLALQSVRIAELALMDEEAAKEEMLHLRAATANLAAAEAVTVQNLITDWVSKVLRAIILGGV
ncbi:MAG: hypothetical protein HRT82_16340 [Henriciella sp.]|nr:hypothetical protein [Henriciella sp.]